MTPPSDRKTGQRRRSGAIGIAFRVAVAVPALLLIAWWLRGYFITDWWIHQRPPMPGQAGEIRGVRASGGTLSYWHMTAEPVSPELSFIPFSPIEGSASNSRSGWFWDSEMRRGEEIEPADSATLATPLGFIHGLDGSDRTPGQRWSREAWAMPFWAIVLPALLPYLATQYSMSRRKKRDLKR